MKAIIDNQLLPEINIRESVPMRLLRFRIVSNNRNVASQWSTIQKVVPDKYKWFDITSSNVTKTPMAIQYNHSTRALSWYPNKFSGAVTGNLVNVTTISVDNNLRPGDEILLPEFANYSTKRDGVFSVVTADASSVAINLNPVSNNNLYIGKILNFAVSMPTLNVDVYLRFWNSLSPLASVTDWFHFVTGSTSMTLNINPTQFPAAPADTLEVALQMPTQPKMRYTVNEQSPDQMCEILLCKTLIKYKQTTALI